MSRGFVLVVAVLVALVAAIPAASASHTYGHRYLVVGRILDADGNPVQNRAVTISTNLGGNPQAIMRTTTDCMGDFWSPEGQEVFDAADYVEGPNAQGETYFHYHDAQMTTQIRVDVTVGNETWNEGFNPSTRYTAVRHQLTTTYEPDASCGSFDAFKQGFTLVVSMTTSAELETGEDTVNARPLNVTLAHANGTTSLDRTTDSNGKAVFAFSGVSIGPGSTVTIHSEALGDDRTVTLTGEDVTFRWRDASFTARESGDGGTNFLPLLIFLGVVAVLIVAFVGYHKMRERMELRKAYQQTERKRARRKS